LPNRLISVIAAAGPRDTSALAALDGVRRWRAESFGSEIVAVLAAP
jgi:HRDC domain